MKCDINPQTEDNPPDLKVIKPPLPASTINQLKHTYCNYHPNIILKSAILYDEYRFLLLMLKSNI